MPLFQRTVIKKHLLELNNTEIDAAYKRFTDYFHNSTIQKNIREAKEEQFQEGFLRELFGHIMGYTLNPNPNFNLTTELKNTTNSKKADGAILIDGKAIAVIELKGTETTDLNKIEVQAFGYKNNQSECTYVITSNFEKLRFYIDNTIDYEEFNLFTLNREQFNLLYLCLSYENIKNNVPKRLKAESVSQEDQITKKLYKDYSEFKRSLFNNLVELNPHYDKLLLFKKTQKLLDRFLFIFFAEDRLLLPTNLIFRINQEWKNLQAMRIPVSLYERYMVYFNDLNHGAKVTLPAFGKKTGEAITAEFEIFAYNGGLFLPDEVLNNVKIDDVVLHTFSEKLSHYDFDSDVDVNILGHIFENSLNEIDEIKSEIEGEVVDKTKTKRKKDGVFYTPKYITKYIVDNTVGKICEEKKAEIKLNDEDYINDKKLQTKTKKALLDKLSDYRNWLLDLTICDPACGSGAFLNQALEFLIAEHRYVDELQAKLMGDAMILSDVETSILENNIYGVDLNDESVEIAKLSLWLRTAQKGRKLNSLNNNIKSGNSLIDDPAVEGDKAFSWEKEFPEVFAKGGFDVVIGNPPYVQSHSLDDNTKDFIYRNFKSAEYQINTYGIFLEKIIQILRDQMYFSVIIPNYWLSTQYDDKLRKLMFLENECYEVLNVFSVFEDATVDTVILSIKKTKFSKFPKSTQVRSIDRKIEIIEERLIAINNHSWAFEQLEIFNDEKSDISISFDSKINLTFQQKLSDYISGYQGMKPYEQGKGNPPQTREMMVQKIYHSSTKKDESYFPLIGAGHVQRFLLKENNEYIKYGVNLAASRKIEIFSGERLVLNRILSKEKIDITFLNETYISNTDVFSLIPKPGKSKFLKVLLAIISSKLCATYFKRNNVNLDRKAFPKLNVNNIENFPIPTLIEESIKLFDHEVDHLLELNNDLNKKLLKFHSFLSSTYPSADLGSNLKKWFDLNFKRFIDELQKLNKKSNGTVMNKLQEMEWMEVFETKKKEVLELKSEIEKTDKQIDQLVYALYGLTEEEIKIVEG